MRPPSAPGGATLLGVDIGGTSTRAVLCDGAGCLLGTGTAPGGNLRSSPGGLAVHLAAAARAALDGASRNVSGRDGSGRDGSRLAAVCAGVAGAGPARREEAERAVRAGLSQAGIEAPLVMATDLDIAFRAASPGPDGCLLIAGTGAIAGRYAGWRLLGRRDGLGWLLGDTGSGAWIGRRVLRAAAADLDRNGPSTALTAQVLTVLGLDADAGAQDLIRACDELRPAQWARFARPALDLGDEDAAASRIVARAASALVATLAAAREDDDGPVVLAGGLLAAGPLRSAIEEAYPGSAYAAHPVVGACAAAGASIGSPVDREALATALAAT